MDNTAAATITTRKTEFQAHVRAAELSELLDQYLSKIKILSLDCFDTLLWRSTAAPSDVFYDLQHRPFFHALGFTARLRREAEKMARKKMQLQNDVTEVTLKDIYLAAYHTLNEDQLNGLTADELSAEFEACYAFTPIIELMRKAHSLKLKIVIVSDTYFNESQLRHLLEKKLPADVMKSISHIFCSCEHGKSKSRGLFKQILEKLYVPPQSILHIGDNQIADVNAVRALNINAVRLLHHNNDVAELLRMQALSACYIDPKIRNSRSLVTPFRSLLAEDIHLQGKPENTIGYASVGPIMYAFGKYICNEVEQMHKEGKRPKVLFLLRDAYLPSLICNTIAGKEIGSRVCISRFSAFAASFRHTNDIDIYLASRIQSKQFMEMCSQLLLPDEITASIVQKSENANNSIGEFSKQIHQEYILSIIFRESAAYRARLFQHLKKECGLEKGDTLLFVDLGYTGTAHIKLEPIFKEEMDIDIIGRYLIALPTPHGQLSRRGLLDASHYDDNTLVMLVTYIALLEQICTSKKQSVVDYDVSGHPIYSTSSFNEQQYNKLDAVQAECIRFAQDAENKIRQNNIHITDQMLRDTAAINLCRLLFLPIKSEIDYLQTFQFDFNMGSNEMVSVIDFNKGLTGLRRRSWLHCSKESSKDMRTNYPAEWRTASLELSLTLMAQHRFGLEFALNDLSLRREHLEIIIFQGQPPASLVLEAMPTHDGYFSALIPVVNPSCPIGVRFGQRYHWVELESADLIHLNTLYSRDECKNTQDASDYMSVSDMHHKEGGLFECTSPLGLLIFNPANKISNIKYILRIIFRPIVVRQQ